MARDRNPPVSPTTRRRRGRPPGGGRPVDRHQMLLAAEELIRAAGPDVTMEQLADASSVTKPILYRNVGDREAVVAALADRFVGRVNEAAAETIDITASGRTQLRQVLGAYLDTVAADRNVFLFISADSLAGDRVSRAVELAAKSADPLAGTLRHAGVGADDAAAWSYAIVGAAQFATFRWLHNDEQTAEAVAEQLTNLLWSGIGGPARRGHATAIDRSTREGSV